MNVTTPQDHQAANVHQLRAQHPDHHRRCDRNGEERDDTLRHVSVSVERERDEPDDQTDAAEGDGRPLECGAVGAGGRLDPPPEVEDQGQPDGGAHRLADAIPVEPEHRDGAGRDHGDRCHEVHRSAPHPARVGQHGHGQRQMGGGDRQGQLGGPRHATDMQGDTTAARIAATVSAAPLSTARRFVRRMIPLMPIAAISNTTHTTAAAAVMSTGPSLRRGPGRLPRTGRRPRAWRRSRRCGWPRSSARGTAPRRWRRCDVRRPRGRAPRARDR